ncbi:MAG TPA: Uma2 family endonuclease [Verrucomicrobia bacterium]|nr:Uma2 family endonuclease [Verrucomicrobiota bacterium]
MSTAIAYKDSTFTWSDYRSWPDDERWEIVGGEAFDMSSAPLTRHQLIVGELTGQMYAHFKGHRCRVWPAPVDVKLSEEDIVQPDLLVVCDPAQIQRTYIEGAPALVIEVLSEASLFHDRVRKMGLYARSGVREYWLVTPYPHLIEVYELAGDAYTLRGGYTRDDTLASPSFPALHLDLASVFDFPLAPGEAVKMVKEGRPPY